MRFSTSLIILGFLSSTASAQNEIKFQTTLPPLPVPSSQSGQISAFDPALGVLRSVEVTLSGTLSGVLSFENTNASPTVAPDYSFSILILGTGPNGFLGSAPNPAFEYDPIVPPALGAYDGTLDFAGTSAVSIPYANASGTGAPSMTYPIFAEGSLPVWIGPAGAPGNVSFSFNTVASSTGSLPSGIQETHTTFATIKIHVRYTYDVLPTGICRGLQSSGCPCGNWSLNNGGCRNSASGAGGAVLTLSGTHSISADSASLTSSLTPSTAPVLFFQGTSFSHVQTVLGDGLLCVGGTITRLSVKFGSGGVANYPGAGDPSLSVAGGVVTPGNRYYQASYRDIVPFCTTATHNITSGLAVNWLP